MHSLHRVIEVARAEEIVAEAFDQSVLAESRNPDPASLDTSLEHDADASTPSAASVQASAASRK